MAGHLAATFSPNLPFSASYMARIGLAAFAVWFAARLPSYDSLGAEDHWWVLHCFCMDQSCSCHVLSAVTAAVVL